MYRYMYVIFHNQKYYFVFGTNLARSLSRFIGRHWSLQVSYIPWRLRFFAALKYLLDNYRVNCWFCVSLLENCTESRKSSWFMMSIQVDCYANTLFCWDNGDNVLFFLDRIDLQEKYHLNLNIFLVTGRVFGKHFITSFLYTGY